MKNKEKIILIFFIVFYCPSVLSAYEMGMDVVGYRFSTYDHDKTDPETEKIGSSGMNNTSSAFIDLSVYESVFVGVLFGYFSSDAEKKTWYSEVHCGIEKEFIRFSYGIGHDQKDVSQSLRFTFFKKLKSLKIGISVMQKDRFFKKEGANEFILAITSIYNADYE